MSFANCLIESVRLIISNNKHFPRELYATWDYVRGDKRVCHQRTMALLAHAAWMLPSNPIVELEDCFDVGYDQLKQKTIKWHPDMLLRSSEELIGDILLFVDFESPNSSDFRVIDRDIELWYMNWSNKYHGLKDMPEYLIITSLPNEEAPQWDCRYSRADGYNPEKAKKNPFLYWYSIYRSKFKPEWNKYPIRFANFNGDELKAVDL